MTATPGDGLHAARKGQNINGCGTGSGAPITKLAADHASIRSPAFERAAGRDRAAMIPAITDLVATRAPCRSRRDKEKQRTDDG